MTTQASDKISTTQILVPMSIMAFTMALLFAFQLTQVTRDRDALQQTVGRMEQQVQDSQKVNAQFGGLVVGTQKLAGEGNKIAQDFVDRLKKIGVIMDQPAKPASAAPIPDAMNIEQGGPVKP